MNMTLGGCSCCKCVPCSDGKFWNQLKWTISGVEAQGATIDSTGSGTPVFTTTIDLSSLNGEHTLDAIYHQEPNETGVYKSGYDTSTMGEVGQNLAALIAEDDCVTVYEITITGVASDIYRGDASYAEWTDADYHLTDCDMRIRIYEKKVTDTTVDLTIVSVTPNGSGGIYEDLTAVYEDVDVSTSYNCDSTVLDVSDLPEHDQETCQFLNGWFYSETDTWDDGFGPYSNASFGLIDPPPAVLSGTANWTFEGAGTRVESL